MVPVKLYYEIPSEQPYLTFFVSKSSLAGFEEVSYLRYSLAVDMSVSGSCMSGHSMERAVEQLNGWYLRLCFSLFSFTPPHVATYNNPSIVVYGVSLHFCEFCGPIINYCSVIEHMESMKNFQARSRNMLICDITSSYPYLCLWHRCMMRGLKVVATNGIWIFALPHSQITFVYARSNKIEQVGFNVNRHRSINKQQVSSFTSLSPIERQQDGLDEKPWGDNS